MAFCMNCGARLADTDRFCAACGTTVSAGTPPPPLVATPAPDDVPVPDAAPLAASSEAIPATGFSALGGSEAMRTHAAAKDRNAWIGFAVACAAILMLLLLFKGMVGDPAVLDLPTALGTAAFFMLVALYFTGKAAARRNAHWDGVLAEKRIRTKTDRREHGPSRRHVFHELHFQTSTGRRYRIDVTKSAWELFQPGEQVRKHRGFLVPERFVKIPGRTMCCSCSRLNDAGRTTCDHCRAPLFT